VVRERNKPGVGKGINLKCTPSLNTPFCRISSRIAEARRQREWYEENRRRRLEWDEQDRAWQELHELGCGTDTIPLCGMCLIPPWEPSFSAPVIR